MVASLGVHKHTRSILSVDVLRLRCAVLSTSVLALLIGAPAWAQCGNQIPNAVLNCIGANYTNLASGTNAKAIDYTGSQGLTLNFVNPATTITPTGPGTPFAGVFVDGTGSLEVNAASLDSVTGFARGFVVGHNSGSGVAALNIDGARIETSASSNSALASYGAFVTVRQASSADGNLTIENSNILLNPKQNSAGIAVNNAGTGGSANIVISDTNIETRGAATSAVNSLVSNPASTGSASVVMTGGSIQTDQNTAGAYSAGIISHNNGLGSARTEINNVTIDVRGSQAPISSISSTLSGRHGVASVVGNADPSTPQNAASTAAATTIMNGGSIQVGAMDTGNGLAAVNWAMGRAEVTMNSGSVSTTGFNANAVLAGVRRFPNNTSSAIATVLGATISTTGVNSAGVAGYNDGLGLGRAEVRNRSQVRVTGNTSSAVSVRSRRNTEVYIEGPGTVLTADGSDGSAILVRQLDPGALGTFNVEVEDGVIANGGRGSLSAGIETTTQIGNRGTVTIQAGALIDGRNGRAGYWDLAADATLISAGEITGGTAIGNNALLVGANAPNSFLAIDTGAGNDRISLIMDSDTSGAVNTGTGDDVVSVGSNLTGNTATLIGNIVTAAGADEVNLLGGSDVTGSVLTGEGNDIVRTGNTFVTTVPPSGTLGGTAVLSNGIDTGNGDDTITIRDGSTIAITSATYGLSTGAGDDTFSIQSSSATDLASLSGGINTGTGDDSGRLGDNSVVAGDVLMANGSDELVITGGADITSVTAIDGGDDVSPADGWVDVVHLDGGTRSFDGGDLTNWETVNLRNNADITFSGSDLVTGGSANNGPSGLPHGLTVQSGSFARFDGSFTVDGNLNNAGTVDLSLDGAVGTTVNVTSNYVGTAGSSLLIDVSLDDGGLDNLPTTDVIRSDLLHVSGNASGSTSVFVTNLGGLGNYTDLNQNDIVENNEGILFAQVEGNSTAGLFTLGGPVTVGAFTYDLVAFDPATSASGFWDYVLANRFSEPTKTYETYPRAVMFTMPTLHQRVGNRHWTGMLQPEIAATEIFCKDPARNFRCTITEEQAAYYDDQKLIEEDSGWIRVVGSRAFVAPTFSTVGVDSYNVETLEIQAGIDELLREDDEGNKWIGGLNAQISTSGVTGNDPTGDASMKATALGIGGTLTYYQPNGFYTDLQARIMGVSTDFESATSGSYDNARAVVLSASAEVGRKYELDNGWRVVPQAQLTYTQAHFRSFTDSAGTVVNPDNAESLKLRVGVAVGRERAWQADDGTTRRLEVEAGLHLHEELAGRTRVAVSGTPLYNKEDDTTAEITLGATYNWNNDQNSVYGEIGVQTGLRNFGRSHRVSGTLGFRRRWD